MIFLLNRERVIMEVLEIARFKISKALGVSPRDVKTRVEIQNGKLSPVFDVAKGNLNATEDEVREAVASIYAGITTELAERLEGLQSTRSAA